jgi:AcrR family transcriptional regulator
VSDLYIDRGANLSNVTDQLEAVTKTPRKPRSDGERARKTILTAAVALATSDGIEGLTIGHLAAASGMSKSGLYAHFGSKLELQLATVEEAAEVFNAEVVKPALGVTAGVAQLIAFCEGYLAHIARGDMPSGCFFAGAALELGARPGPVKERVADFQAGLATHLRTFVTAAREHGELPTTEDTDLLAFEIGGFLLNGNSNYVLFGDPRALEVARNVIRRRLGLPPT